MAIFMCEYHWVSYLQFQYGLINSTYLHFYYFHSFLFNERQPIYVLSLRYIVCVCEHILNQAFRNKPNFNMNTNLYEFYN